MAKFEVKIVRIDSAEKHPGADRLTINRIGGYVAITNMKEDGTWRFQTGDLAVYVPENAVLPEAVLKLYGYWDEANGKGFLSGDKGDRVRPRKLQKMYSEGLLLPVPKETVNVDDPLTDGWLRLPEDLDLGVNVGDDVAAALRITKYIPTIPEDMLGNVYIVEEGLPSFDVEPYEKNTDAFLPDEEVVATEKLHGSFTGISYIPGYAFPVVWSKGFDSSKPLAFEKGPENDKNIYVRSVRKLLTGETGTMLRRLIESAPDSSFHIFGETFGPGVQKGHQYGLKELEFRAFDIYQGEWRKGKFLDTVEFETVCGMIELPSVPVLYRGRFDLAALTAVVGGKDSISGKDIREGIVVRPYRVREHHGERLLLKMVNPEYKLRKGEGVGEELS